MRQLGQRARREQKCREYDRAMTLRQFSPALIAFIEENRLSEGIESDGVVFTGFFQTAPKLPEGLRQTCGSDTTQWYTNGTNMVQVERTSDGVMVRVIRKL